MVSNDEFDEAIFLQRAYGFLDNISFGHANHVIRIESSPSTKSVEEDRLHNNSQSTIKRPIYRGMWHWPSHNKSADALRILPPSPLQQPKRILFSTLTKPFYRSSIIAYTTPAQRKIKRKQQEEQKDRSAAKLLCKKTASFRALLLKSHSKYNHHQQHHQSSGKQSEDDHYKDGGKDSFLSDASTDSKISALSTESSSTTSSSPSSSSSSCEFSSELEYDPLSLDHPNLRFGKNKTVICLPAYKCSINHFTRAETLKKELNVKFKRLHPQLHPSLTLSQIRNVKSRLMIVAQTVDLELSTLARSFAYFEKLIFGKFVDKTNRRAVAASCLLLATKATDARSTAIPTLIQKLSHEFGIAKSLVFDLEFSVFAALQFRLQIDHDQIGVHLERILYELDMDEIDDWVGEEMAIIFYNTRSHMHTSK